MSLPSRRLVASLLALAALAPSARAADNLYQVIGWSPDEQRFAVRVFHYSASSADTGMGSEEESDDSCAGYLDDKGKPFNGSLSLELYAKGKKLADYPIQDGDKCTPPKVARERLNKAKAALAKQGIDLKQKQPGTELKLERKGRLATVTVKEGPGAPYTLEGAEEVEDVLEKEAGSEEDVDDNGFMTHQVKGALVVYVRKGGERRQLLSTPIEGTYTAAMGGGYGESLAQVWLSPQGKTAVFFSEATSGNMRGREDVFHLLGVVSWEGTPLVLR